MLYALTLDFIGCTYGGLDRLNQALEYLIKGLSIKEKIKAREQFYCVISIYCIGFVYYKQNKLN